MDDDLSLGIAAQANKFFSGSLTPALQPFGVGALGFFPFFWQNPRNLEFNALTYNWISANVLANSNPVALDQTFTSLYLSVLASISYQLSGADQAKLNNAAADRTNRQFALLQAWKQAFGSIPPATATRQPIDIVLDAVAATWATPSTSLTAMQLASDLKTLLNSMPNPQGPAIFPVLCRYIDALNSNIMLQNESSKNTGWLQHALAGVESATLENGGLTTDDGLIRPAYTLNKPLTEILDGLNSTSNVIRLQASVTPTDTEAFAADTGRLFRIPAQALSIRTPGNVDSRSTANPDAITLEFTFPGVTFVGFGPAPFDPDTSQNWFWPDPIVQSIRNGNRDITGFKFLPRPTIDFSANGPFGFLTGVAISRFPTVQMVTGGDHAQRMFGSLAPDSPAAFHLIYPKNQILKFRLSSAQLDQNKQTASLSFTVPASPDGPESRAYVLGVQTRFPAAGRTPTPL